jgi:hypothetical protein
MPDLERILQLTPGTLSQQWMQDGVAVDPGTVTIGITRADGTVLVAAGTAVAGSGSAPRTFNLTTTHTSLLDRLKITWTSSLKGTVISYLEVVGGRLFTMAEALSRPQLASVTPVNLELARLRAEQYLERRCGGRSFFPRYSFESHPIDGTLVVDHPGVRTIRSVSISGVPFDVTQLAVLTWQGPVIIGYNWATSRTRWTPVIIGYEYGDDFPEEAVRDAGLDLAEDFLTAVSVEAGIDPRATRITTSEGTIAFGREIRSIEPIIRDYGLRPLML